MNRNAKLTGIAMAFQFMSNFTRHHVWKTGNVERVCEVKTGPTVKFAEQAT
jgi:hypothetical protein